MAALAVTAALVPAALALACNPQAYLTLGQGSYAPGDTVKVSGSFFKSSWPITVSLDRTGQEVSVTTSANGSFQANFALPANAPTGGYTVQAIGFENGAVVPGLPARASFTVANPVASQPTPQPTAPTPSQPSPQASQSTPAATAPATTTARPTARPAGKPSADFREPRVFSEPNVSKSTSGSTSSSKPAAARSDRVAVGGRAVFGGSVAPTTTASAFVPATVAPVTGATTSRSATSSRGSSATAPTSRQAAAQTATDDVWGTQTSGSSPSVLPFAGDGVTVTSPRAGSQLTLGIVLLGAGMLALLGGLAAGEARRRRVHVR
jgi:hypothetical protein